MAEKFRIRFNPTTKEIEIEGTEKFVKKYFEIIQNMILATRGSEPAQKAAQPGRAKKRGRGRWGSKAGSVLKSIRESKKGITTAELKNLTGLSDRQIWAIIYKAEKEGKIKKAGRGIYIAA